MLIPCHNEEAAIGQVVRNFRTALPEATVFCYDNNSTDQTIACAREAGARIGREARQGKGHVVRRMFADIEADYYILVDGDGTYDAAAAPALLRLAVADRLDMVTATRTAESTAAYRVGHAFGNRLLTGLTARLFGARLADMLSGYRVFSRRFVKSFPALAEGFETETEFTVHALQLALPTGELATVYRERAAGSASKLRTWRDGWRILRLIVRLTRDERPIPFFCTLAALLAAAALTLGTPVVVHFVQTGLVPRLPTAIVAACLVLLACLAVACGLILDSVARGRRETKRLAYLAVKLPDFTPP